MFDKNAYSKAYYHKNKGRLSVDRKAYQLGRYNKMLWQSAKGRARKAGLAFTLTPEDVVVPEVCPILGIKIIPLGDRKTGHGASIDRLDPSKGYTPDNIIVCSLRGNMLKSNGTLEEFKKVVAFLSERY